MSRLKVILVLFAFTAVLTNCKKENDRPQWDVSLLGPLVKGSLGIGNLVNDTLVKVNPADSSVTLVYNKTLYSLTIDSLVQIPDTTVANSFSFGVDIPSFPAGASFFVPPGSTKLGVSNVQLSFAIIKSGIARIEATNKLHTKVFFTYTIPKATLNGVPFVVDTFVDSADANGPKTMPPLDIDLSGYNLDLTGIGGSQVNSIEYNVSVQTDPAGPSVSIAKNDTFLVIKNTYVDIIPYYMKGYLGQTTINVGPDSTVLDLFKSVQSGTLNLASAKMKLVIENDIGMDAQLNVINLKSVNTRTNSSVDLIAPTVINQTLNINRAMAAGTTTNPSYIPSFYTVQIDNSNSNFKSLLENLPDLLAYTLRLETNPLGNVSGSNDFAFTDHLVNANLDLDIPLNFSSDHLTFKDTADFALTGDSTLNNLGAGSFIFNVDNGFPFAVNITLVTIDAQNQYLDALISNGLAAAPALDMNNKVTGGKKRSQFIIPLDEARIDLLRRAKKMIVTAAFTTVNAGSQKVKIYSDYTLDFKLIADLKYHVR